MKKIIKLLRRPRKKFKTYNRLHVYDICVVLKSSHGQRVYEKLGVYSLKGNSIRLNIFRLIFWLSKNVSMSGNVVRLFLRSNILQTPPSPNN